MSWPAPRLLVLGAPLVAILVVVAAADPEQNGRYPPCPFHWATGLDCPGCGSLRALHDLLHADFLEAANHNLVLVASAPFLLVSMVLWGLRRPQPSLVHAPATGWVACGLFVCWAVVRNLPYAPLQVLGSG